MSVDDRLEPRPLATLSEVVQELLTLCEELTARRQRGYEFITVHEVQQSFAASLFELTVWLGETCCDTVARWLYQLGHGIDALFATTASAAGTLHQRLLDYELSGPEYVAMLLTESEPTSPPTTALSAWISTASHRWHELLTNMNLSNDTRLREMIRFCKGLEKHTSSAAVDSWSKQFLEQYFFAGHTQNHEPMTAFVVEDSTREALVHDCRVMCLHPLVQESVEKVCLVGTESQERHEYMALLMTKVFHGVWMSGARETDGDGWTTSTGYAAQFPGFWTKYREVVPFPILWRTICELFADNSLM